MSIHALAIAKQTARGTAATAAAYRMPLTGGTVEARRVVNVLEETGDSRLRDTTWVSEVGVQGSPELAARVDSIGLILYLALGAKSVTGVADPYAHVFTNASTRPYATLWRMLQNLLWERMVDCKLTQVVLTSEHGQPLKLGLTVQGLDPQSLTQTTFNTEVAVAQESGAPIIHYDGSGAFTIDGTVVSSIEKIVVTINNNDTFQQGDSLRGYDLPEGMLDITIETTQLIENAALYNTFHYGSATPTTGTRAVKTVASLAAGVDFLWTQVAASPGPERSLEIEAPQLDIVTVAGFTPNTNSDPLKATNTYRVMRPTSGAGLTATLKNGVATY